MLKLMMQKSWSWPNTKKDQRRDRTTYQSWKTEEESWEEGKLEQKYTFKNFVYDVMEAGFTQQYLKSHNMTTKRAKKGKDVKTSMEERVVNMISEYLKSCIILRAIRKTFLKYHRWGSKEDCSTSCHSSQVKRWKNQGSY